MTRGFLGRACGGLSLGKSSYHRRQLQANPVRSAELVPANDQQTDAVGT